MDPYITGLSRMGLQKLPTASLQRDKDPATESPGYDTKQSHGEATSKQNV